MKISYHHGNFEIFKFRIILVSLHSRREKDIMAITLRLPLWVFGYRTIISDTWISYLVDFAAGVYVSVGIKIVATNEDISEFYRNYNPGILVSFCIFLAMAYIWVPFVLLIVITRIVTNDTVFSWQNRKKWTSHFSVFSLGMLATFLTLVFMNVSFDTTQIEKGRYCIDPNDEPISMVHIGIGTDGIETSKTIIHCQQPLVISELIDMIHIMPLYEQLQNITVNGTEP